MNRAVAVYQKHFILFMFIFSCTLHLVKAQQFKGIIHYKIHHDIKKGITVRTVWKETQGNYMDYYTDGCSTRISYRYDDTVLWSEIYDCESKRSYLVYSGVNQVLWHEKAEVKIKTEVVAYEENVMDILGIPCNRMVIEYAFMSQQGKVEYFLSRQHQISIDAFPFDAFIAVDSIEGASCIPLAIVAENEGMLVANEAIEVVPNDSLPRDLFLPPANSKLVPNGLILETPPQPRRGYDWWYSKINSSMSYPLRAFKEGRDERVLVMFTITEEGKMTDIAVVNEADADFRQYVVEYLQRLIVRWKPGIQDGKPITSAMVLPITF